MTTPSSPDDLSVALALPFTPRSASVARSRLVEFLSERAQPRDLIDDSTLVVSELVGNAVRHARPLPDGTMVVGWVLVEDSAAAVDIFVTDGGSDSVPHPVVNEEADAFGRGLTLVEALASRWWYETVEGPEPRATVHALLGLEAAAHSA